MEQVTTPPVLLLEGSPENRAVAWQNWLKNFKDFLQNSGMDKYNKAVQAQFLLRYIGADGRAIYSTFKIEGQDDDIDKLIQKYDEHFRTNINTTIARFKFFTKNQMLGEDIDAYVKELRLLSQHCMFEHLEDSLIRDRIICGIIDSDVSFKLLNTDGLTLEKAVKICKENEVLKETKSQKHSGAVETTRGTTHTGSTGAALEDSEALGHSHSAPVKPARNATATVLQIPQKKVTVRASFEAE